MRDALAVRGGESREDLSREQERTLERQRPGERLAVDQLHDEVVRPDVVERADVRMIERGHGTGFALEPFAELLGGELDGDLPTQAGVAGPIDFAHARQRQAGPRIS